jgi:hypothetical protein
LGIRGRGAPPKRRDPGGWGRRSPSPTFHGRGDGDGGRIWPPPKRHHYPASYPASRRHEHASQEQRQKLKIKMQAQAYLPHL